MLKSISYSLPFILVRILIVAVEGAVLVLATYFTHKLFMSIMSGFVGGLFLTFLNPMGYIIGLAVATYLMSILLKPLMYYVKLVQIIFVTTIVLDYPVQGYFRFAYSNKQARENWGSLAIHDVTTKGIVKALNTVLTAIKEAILNLDIMAHLKEPETPTAKFYRSMLLKPLKHVMDMLDELVMSYTWFTTDLYKRDNNDKEPKLKTRALFMLEALVFTIKIFPRLIVLSIAGELFFFIVANTLAITAVITFLSFVKWSVLYIILCIVIYNTIVKLVYYAIVESLRVTFYIHIFYSQLASLEPLDFSQEIANIASRVPALAPLIKKSGMDIQVPSAEQGRILGDDFKTEIREAFVTMGSAFSLNSADLLVDDDSTNDVSQDVTSPYVVQQPTVKVTPREQPPITGDPDLDDALGDLDDDLGADLDVAVDPFSMEGGLNRRR